MSACQQFWRCVIVSAIFLYGSIAFSHIVVIGNPQIKVAKLSQQQVINLYLDKPVELSSGETLSAYDQRNVDPAYHEFYSELLGWSGSQVNRYWAGLVFSGEASQPPEVPGSQAAIELVANTPNAIAYVDSQDLKKVTQGTVKILYGQATLQPANQNDGNSDDSVNDATLNASPAASNAGQNAAYNQVNVDSSASQNQQLTDIFSAVRMNLQLGGDANVYPVSQAIVWYLQHPKLLQASLHNALPYIGYVFEQVQRRKMPAEIALLPMVASAYSPDVKTQKNMAGIWQLSLNAAHTNRLVIDHWYDGRLDVPSATNVALNKLQYLYQQFDNWYLAIAAYQLGAADVKAAIAYNQQLDKSTDFWQLPLPQDTQNYVAKLLALATIINNPARFQVNLPSLSALPLFSSVTLSRRYNIAQLAKLANVKPEVIKILNPGLTADMTPPTQQFKVQLPIQSLATFAANQKQGLSTVMAQSTDNAPMKLNWAKRDNHLGDLSVQALAPHANSVTAAAILNGQLSQHAVSQDVVPPLPTEYQPGQFANSDKTAPSKTESPRMQRINDLKNLLEMIYGV